MTTTCPTCGLTYVGYHVCFNSLPAAPVAAWNPTDPIASGTFSIGTHFTANDRLLLVEVHSMLLEMRRRIQRNADPDPAVPCPECNGSGHKYGCLECGALRAGIGG